jgi:hypothetical protein
MSSPLPEKEVVPERKYKTNEIKVKKGGINVW